MIDYPNDFDELTNAEVYEMVFGFKVDHNNCPTYDCKKCPLHCRRGICCPDDWWNEKYKRPNT